MAMSLESALGWWARTKGDERALVVDEDQGSYRVLDEWTSRVARALVARGVEVGDRVALPGTNSLEWAAVGEIRRGRGPDQLAFGPR